MAWAGAAKQAAVEVDGPAEPALAHAGIGNGKHPAPGNPCEDQPVLVNLMQIANRIAQIFNGPLKSRHGNFGPAGIAGAVGGPPLPIKIA